MFQVVCWACVPLSNRFCPEGSCESVVYILLLMDAAKLFWREGMWEFPALDSPLLECRRSSGSNSAGKAHA
jgi:hypothetical protein